MGTTTNEASDSASASGVPLAEDIVRSAAASGEDGVASYSHGNRQVTRLNPRNRIELAQDLELREQRKRRGIWMYCDQGG